MNGGRRPRQVPSIAVNPQAKKVQDSIDDIAEDMLAELKLKIRERIEAGDLKRTKLPELLAHFSKLVNAIKKPATSLNLIQVPNAPQLPADPGRRDKVVEAGAAVNAEQLETSQECYLRSHPEVPR